MSDFTRTYVRWMIRRDMPEVLAIDGAGPDRPWGEEEFLARLRERSVIGMVAEGPDGRVVGFTVYRLKRRSLVILRFAVDPGLRRRRIGRQLAAKLVGKLSVHRRTELTVEVSERNTRGHHFLKAVGFRAESVGFGCGERGEDVYAFAYLLPADEAGTDRHFGLRAEAGGGEA